MVGFPLLVALTSTIKFSNKNLHRLPSRLQTSARTPLSTIAPALAGLRKYINSGARIGILMALCLVLMSPEKAAVHLLILAAIFSVLGVIAAALIYVLLSIVVSLLKIGLLLVAAIVVSGLVIRGCTPTIGKVAAEKTNAMQLGLKPQINHGKQLIMLS
jgi:hypothetical protein